MRAIALSEKRRATAMPQVPTVSETRGLESVDMGVWSGLLAPAKTPPEVVDLLNRGNRPGAAPARCAGAPDRGRLTGSSAAAPHHLPSSSPRKRISTAASCRRLASRPSDSTPGRARHCAHPREINGQRVARNAPAHARPAMSLAYPGGCSPSLAPTAPRSTSPPPALPAARCR
ncbi:tripartite tricarboxylate transporter substrate-binding protein [Cupriavidus basilensis]